MRLTDLQIKKLKAPEAGQKTYFDEGLPGFGLRVSQGGTKSFVVMYGKRRQLRTIGRYPATSLAEARLEAKRIQVEVTLVDALPTTTASKISFAKARAQFLADCGRRNKSSTTEEYRRLLVKHFKFEQDISDLNRSSISQALDALSSTPSEQKHAFVALRTMMNWCVKRGWLENSPVPPLSFAVVTRERVLTDDELVAVWHRAEEYGYPFGRIVQLLILTGQRRGEIAGLRFGWIDEDAISFPAGFTKNKRPHIVPLGPIAIGLIEKLPDGEELLFPARGRTDTPFSGWSKSKPKLDKPLNIAPYTLHDLRRTYSSTMAHLGVPIHVTERLLNHVSGTISGVAAIYNRHSYRKEMREAVAAYEAHLAKLFAT